MLEPMRSVAFPANNGKAAAANISVLGFGCSAVMGRVGRSDSLRAMAAAWDAGINFFDTARSYGYGESERVVGQFLKGRRGEAILCTKFGIQPAAGSGWKRGLKPVAQAVIKAVPSLRGYARSQAAAAFVATPFSVDLLRGSLETSLRELGTDYVDILLLHAAPMEALRQTDLYEALERLIAEGKIRMAGISGTHDVIEQAFEHGPPVLTTAQFAMDPENFAFAAVTERTGSQRMFLVANHPFGGPDKVKRLAARIEALRDDETLPAGLREMLSPNDPQVLPEVIFGCILTGTGISAIVPSMMRPENLRSNVAALQNCRFTPEQLTLLRERLAH